MVTDSGTLTTPEMENNYFMQIDWTAVSDPNTMKCTITVKAYINANNPPFPNRAFRLYDDNRNYARLDSNYFFSENEYGTGTYNNPWLAYTWVNSSGHDRVGYYENWISGPGWVYAIANLGSVTVTKDLNSDGYCTFEIEASIFCRAGGGTANLKFDTTEIHTTPVETSSKIGHKTGGSWGNDGRVWHKEGGQWLKRNLYRKESGSWNKK